MGVYGFSSLISNYIMLEIMNPENVPPLNNDGEYYFPEEIAERLPNALRILSFYLLGTLIVGNVLQFEYKEEENEGENEGTRAENDKNKGNNDKTSEISKKVAILTDDDKKESFISKPDKVDDSTADLDLTIPNQLADETHCTSLSSAFKSKVFYLLILMAYFSIQNGYFIASNFKNYGILMIKDDSFLTLIGSLGSIFNGAGRFFWGTLSDRFSFKSLYLLIVIIQMVDAATMRYIHEYKEAYLLWVCLAFLCEGGHFVLFPPLCLKVFGNEVGGRAYGVILMGISCGNLTQFGLNLALRGNIGFEMEFYIFLGFNAISLIMCMTNEIRFKK